MRLLNLAIAALSAAVSVTATEGAQKLLDYSDATKQMLGVTAENMKGENGLRWDRTSFPVTVQYKTSEPNGYNWVGIYHEGDKPKEKESITWEWAGWGSGAVRLNQDKLGTGNYTVYFIRGNGDKEHDEKHESLCDPIDVVMYGYEPYFPVEEFTSKNARAGEEYDTRVDTLLWNEGSGTMKYTKLKGDDWIQVSSDGRVSGTPQDSDAGKTAHVKISATVTQDTDDSRAPEIRINIPVRKSSERLVDELTVLSMNMWHGGKHVDNSFDKQTRAILLSNADVVGLQEATHDVAGFDLVGKLAKYLGWEYRKEDRSAGVLSRYPFDDNDGSAPFGAYGKGAGGLVNLNGDADEKVKVSFWSSHLSYTPYGPYLLHDGWNNDDVIWSEWKEGHGENPGGLDRSGRADETQDLINHLTSDELNGYDTILVGDHNAPSHLDYTEETKAWHYNAGDLAWPNSKIPIDKGFKDSYREVHPKPQENEWTWSPIALTFQGDETSPAHKDQPEPKDRVDFIYHKGDGLEVKTSDLPCMGWPSPVGNYGQKFNEWPTDHRAVLTVFRLK